MGWICITDACNGHIDLDSGLWDGVGMAYFSIADEVGVLHDIFFDFLLGVSGSIYLMGAILLIITLVVSIMISIKRSAKNAI